MGSSLIEFEEAPHQLLGKNLSTIRETVLSLGYVLFRGTDISDKNLEYYCSRIGLPYTGSVFTIDVRFVRESRARALSLRKLEPHNECAYEPIGPSFVVLGCQDPGSRGGDFYLIDSQDVIDRLGSRFLEMARRIIFKVRSPRTGAVTTRCLLVGHPLIKGFEVLKYSSIGSDDGSQAKYEPVNSSNYESELLIERLNRVLSEPVIHRIHHWRKGDLVIFDNYRMLHGRYAYAGESRRLSHVRLR